MPDFPQSAIASGLHPPGNCFAAGGSGDAPLAAQKKRVESWGAEWEESSMDPASPLVWQALRLLLVQLLLSCKPLEAGTQNVSVEAPALVRGFLGANITLPCVLQPRGTGVSMVIWQRLGDPHGNVATLHHSGNTQFSHPGRMEFAAAGSGQELRNGSLIIRELSVHDEANYTCNFVIYPHGNREAHTWLRVLARPRSQAEALNVDLPVHPEPVTMARCVSTGGRPPALITWSLTPGWQVNTSQASGPLPGTVTVTSLLTLVPSSQVDSQNVTCRVEHESFKEPDQLVVTLSVRYPPEVSISGYDDNWYLGRSKVTLNCNARSNPEPTDYMWNTTLGLLPPSTVAQSHQLQIQTVDESTNTTFICSVTNAIGTGRAELTVLVNDRPGAQSRLHICLYIIIPVIAMLLVGVLLWFFCFRNNFAVSSSPVAPSEQLDLEPANRGHQESEQMEQEI
ncbi:PREDICTED: poliovirus receptor [Chrysochloris asiatica]|uniref:Poliovirus receptor n=1 Tax=Chrysochloris asiatica TaxID=185453 RepID=A0A9B0WY48_CHRAS|nr:PREDICTED: poliovirus receptor [Chrysochloris asiatica]